MQRLNRLLMKIRVSKIDTKYPGVLTSKFRFGTLWYNFDGEVSWGFTLYNLIINMKDDLVGTIVFQIKRIKSVLKRSKAHQYHSSNRTHEIFLVKKSRTDKPTLGSTYFVLTKEILGPW